MRITLRLFLSLCVVVSLLVAWMGLVSQKESSLATIKGSNDRRWESFAAEGGYSGDGFGGIRFDGNGNCVSAKVRDARGLQLLLARPSICRSIPSLMIYGSDTFSEFDPSDFPSLERLSLGGVAIDESKLLLLEPVQGLRELKISEFSRNPVDALNVLSTFMSLRSLTVRSDQISSLTDFPDLPQLNFLIIDCVRLPEESVKRFVKRFPNCLVTINVEPYPASGKESDKQSVALDSA